MSNEAAMKNVVIVAVIAISVAAVSVAVRAGHAPAAQPVPAAPLARIPAEAAQRLAGAVRLRTISAEDPAAFDPAAFSALHAYLQASFPRVHATLQREIVATHSLLYTWRGSDAALKPVLVAGHLDVVPVDDGSDQPWRHPPFSGQIGDGFIWGRGAIDNKATVVGTLEAIEMLLAEGVRPVRTVYLAFGHDEEVGGTQGAREIAKLLESRGVALEMVVDEGGVITGGVLPGVKAPVALVGIAEKGFVTIELTARAPGRHSSMPPRETAVGILSAAIARLEHAQMPARFEGATAQLFEAIAPHFPAVQRIVFANLWLTRPLVLRQLQHTPSTNAMVRTTTAPTIFRAGTKDNVLPGSARAVVNFRILPGDSIDAVMAHVRRVVADSRILIEIGGRFTAEPSPLASAEAESFRTLSRAIHRVVPEAIVAPYLVVVATDARHYRELTDNVFRFLPLRLTAHDLDRMHGVDERIEIAAYYDAISVYRQLLLETAAPSLDGSGRGLAPRR
jgi:carboxypeptidase PM20D1